MSRAAVAGLNHTLPLPFIWCVHPIMELMTVAFLFTFELVLKVKGKGYQTLSCLWFDVARLGGL